ncbi:MAG: hypothetical protein RLZZ352_356 [Pseudomonadota bacterium]|jgi:Spy/CpxP family protein refolding chaperone
MTPRFSTHWIAAAVAAAALSLSASAMAQGKNAHEGPDHKAHMEERAARHAKHQAQLKAALKLTPAQETAWKDFVTGTAHPTPKPEDHAAWSKLSTPERLEKMQAHKAERDALMNQHIQATQRFYATLTPEQQKVFDAQTLRHGPMRGMKDDEHRGGRGMHGEGMKHPG